MPNFSSGGGQHRGALWECQHYSTPLQWSVWFRQNSHSLEHITLVNLDAAKSLLISDEFAASRTKFTAPTRGRRTFR